ncbi:MAG: hypothetical protein H7A35_05400 [Planctomycetales bacterium]|nr:hypothetical protein [bacterium]UNM09493.1 MAG: hypothetical protein H7A35_05400 [Planctomycetales bacterium]
MIAMTRNLAAGVALLLLAACGAGNNSLPDAAAERAQYPEKPTLSIADGSLLGDRSAVRFSMVEDDGGITATIDLAKAAQLNTLYTDIAYDPRQYSLDSIETAAGLDGRQLLSLGVNVQPGLVQTGHVLPNFDLAEPLDSSGTLATLHFSRGPQPAMRRTAMVPRNVNASAPMSALAGPMFSGSDALISTVQYTNPGDYDQNGVVTIADLTPLGLHFGKSGPFGEDLLFIGVESYPVETVVDGDGNGEINLADLTVIGQNFGNDALGGYNIYASSNPDDVPASSDAASTIPAASSVPFANGVGDTVTDRLVYGYIQPSAPAGPVTLWARPVDSEGNEGTVSQVVELAGAPGPVLDLDTAPLSGSGSESNPYFVDPNFNYFLMLNHSVDGDVTINDESQYFLIGGFSTGGGSGTGGGEIIRIREVSAGLIGSGFVVPNVGEINQETAEMDIVDIFQGNFSVVATYKGRISNTLYLYAPDLDNLAPVAHITADSTSGVAPWTATLSATMSDDLDGSIEQYDWDLDGDGTYEIEDGAQVQEIDLTGGGFHTVRLRVTDDDLATAVDTLQLSTEGWLSTAIDNVSDTSPADPMMSVIDGNPAIAYRQFNALKYVRAANPQGTEWNIPQAVPLSVTAKHISLRELAGGRPAMAYQRVGANPGIYYVVGNAADATSFQQVQITSDGLDHSPSLNIIDGNPALAYVWHTGDVDDPYSIYYVRATDPVATTGGDWDLFNGGTVWKGSDFHLDKTALTTCEANTLGTDGRPAVWYVLNNDQYNTPWRAYFSKAVNNQGTNWTLLPYSLGNNTPGDHELQFAAATSITDRPYLLARNKTTGGLLVRKANDLSTTDWTAPLYIPDSESDDYGYHLASANVAGFLGLAYYSTEEQAVTYRATQTPEISDDFPVGGVVATGVGEYDTDAHESAYLSVGSALGKPLVVYHDLAAAELKVARYFVP